MCRISSNIVCDAAMEKSVLDKLFLWKYTLFLQNVAVTENSTANCVWDTVQSYFYTWNRFEQGCTSSLRPQQHTTVFWVKVEDGSNGWISSPPPPLPFTEDSLQLSFKPAWARRTKKPTDVQGYLFCWHRYSPHKELPHLLTSWPHHLLVLSNAQLLAVDDAGSLGPWLVLVVGIFLQMDLAQAGLLLVVRLLLLVGHGFPARAWSKWLTAIFQFLF